MNSRLELHSPNCFKTQDSNVTGGEVEDKRLKFQEGKQGELLETVIKAEFNSFGNFAKFIGLSRRTILDWRIERYSLPKSVFEKICKAFPEYKWFEEFVLEELPEYWNFKKYQKLNNLKMNQTQKKIKDSMKDGDTETLKNCLNLIRKRRNYDKEWLGTTEQLAQNQQIPLNTFGIGFSRKDLIKGITLPSNLSIDLCYVIGVHIGDGSMNIYRRYGQIDYWYRCCGHQINDREWYDNVLVPLKRKLFNLQLKPVNNPDGSCSILFRSKAVISFYSKVIDLPLGKKSAIIDIPKIILDSDPQYVLACISGIFDTDFCIKFKNQNHTVHSYPVIELKVRSSRLIKTISDFLTGLGISNSISDYSKFDKRIKKTIEMYCLAVSGRKNVANWFELIGSRNPNHLSKYLIWKKFGFCPPRLNLPERQRILAGEINPLNYYNGHGGI